MQKKKLTIIFGLSLFILISLVGYISYYFLDWAETKRFARKAERVKKQQKVAREAFETLAKIWQLGDYQGYIERLTSDNETCSKLKRDIERYGDDFTSCNPRLLTCLIESPKFEKKLGQGLDFSFSPPRPVIESYRNRRHLSYVVDVKIGQKKRELHLPDLCDEVPLPRRFYPLDAQTKNRDKMWSSFGQKIFVDKYLVKNRDLKVWGKLSNQKEIKSRVFELMKGAPLEGVATGLTEKEMARYCGFFGKQLLTSQVYDAMSLHPADMGNRKPKKTHFAPFPWAPREREGFLNLKKNVVGNVDMLREDCQKIYTKECHKKFPDLRHAPMSPTWSGIFQTLGGFSEYLVNHHRPRLNLQPSSFYFEVKSDWHKVWQRAYWDGRGFSFRNFNWRFESPEKERSLKVGFRCMRWEYREEKK